MEEAGVEFEEDGELPGNSVTAVSVAAGRVAGIVAVPTCVGVEVSIDAALLQAETIINNTMAVTSLAFTSNSFRWTGLFRPLFRGLAYTLSCNYFFSNG
jgi:hypothetical protein